MMENNAVGLQATRDRFGTNVRVSEAEVGGESLDDGEELEEEGPGADIRCASFDRGVGTPTAKPVFAATAATGSLDLRVGEGCRESWICALSESCGCSLYLAIVMPSPYKRGGECA